MVHLHSTWDLSHQSGEPHTIIRVRNLQTVLPLGTDAWGRANKPQPVLISASVSLTHHFASASETDTVTASTVHYGILSKAVLEGCREFEALLKGAGTGDKGLPMHLRALVQFLHFWLTGEETLQNIPVLSPATTPAEKAEPVLKGQGMRMLEITVKLPKASLLGSGVSLKGSFSYDNHIERKGPGAHSMALTLHELRIPTLIGVNANERCGKQMVVATIKMDRWDRMVDTYCQLEELVVKVCKPFPSKFSVWIHG
jgi:dihydroneopterin aldolase